MKVPQIVLKYYSLKMLLTVDLNSLVSTLVSVFGDSVRLDLSIMDEDEKYQCSNDVEGILSVNERIWLFEELKGTLHRRKDLEERVIAQGQK
ncbi:hypothetical protein ACJJIU_11245 [Microbulbifer sp. CnH-101-E]|uniref:hypothetical protein n=1 Tax=unclassified Microbulbifer TaxID=2619833 RepID=UPI00403A5D91